MKDLLLSLIHILNLILVARRTERLLALKEEIVYNCPEIKGLDTPLRCPVNLPCVTSFPKGSADAACSGFIIQYPASAFLPKIL